LALLGFVWLCLALLGFAWLCLAWLFLALLGFAWLKKSKLLLNRFKEITLAEQQLLFAGAIDYGYDSRMLWREDCRNERRPRNGNPGEG
jgi:hypothetical protein